MSSKYIATEMIRHILRPDTYVFSFDNIIVGEYNEESKIFTDEYGRQYYYMMSGNALTLDNPKSAYNIVKVDDLKNSFKDKNMKEILQEYAKRAQERAYLIGYTDDYTPYLEVIHLDMIQDEASRKLKQMNGEEVSNNSNLDKLNDLILATVDGKFSKEELESMIDKLEDIKDTIENTIGTMETKIGAISENKTFREYLDEQLAKQKDIKKPEPKKATDKEKQDKLKEELKKKYNTAPKKQDTSIIIKEPKKIERINIGDLCKKITKTVIAQDEAVQRLVTEIVRKDMCSIKNRRALLLVGKTGVGKTETMRQLKEYYPNRKVYLVDSTQITVPGYTGKDIAETLWDLYEYCNGKVEDAEKAIIYFDEIDKKGSKDNSDVGGKGVLNVLLPFIEGTTYDAALDTRTSSKIVKINTSNMIVVLGGAFSEVQRHLKKQNEIGFEAYKNSSQNPEYREAEIEDFVKYGQMPDEFMGRITPIMFNDLTKDDLRRILFESDTSELKLQEQIFNKLGVKITYTTDYIDKVVDKAYSLKTGARSLGDIVDKSTLKAFAEANDNSSKYSGIILNANTVDDNSNYQLIKRRK